MRLLSHRNGKPKPHASERTQRRWRDRCDISTTEDNAHFKSLEEVKIIAREFLERIKIIPKKVEDLKISGERKK